MPEPSVASLPEQPQHFTFDGEQYWTERYVADILHRSLCCLKHWRQRKIGPPYVSFNRVILYKHSSFEKWISQHEIKTHSGRKAGGEF